MNGFSRLSIFTAMAMLFFSPIILAVPQLNLELLDDGKAPFDAYASAVDLSHDWAAMGIPGQGSDEGAVCLYQKSGQSWPIHSCVNAPEDPTTNVREFGRSVSLDGETLLISAKHIGGQGRGAVYIFQYQASDGIWQFSSMIQDHEVYAGDDFGTAASVSSTLIAISATGGSRTQGAVYLYHFVDNQWALQQTLHSESNFRSPQFGSSLMLSGNYLVIGDSKHGRGNEGSATVYKHTEGVWSRQASMKGGDVTKNSDYGSSVAISNEYMVVAAKLENSTAVKKNTKQGAVYVYKRDGKSWPLQTKLLSNDAGKSHHFGSAVAIDAEYILIGSEGVGNRQGAAYLFQDMDGIWTQTAKLEPQNGHNLAVFGHSVALSADSLLIASPNQQTDNAGSGMAYLYTMDISTEPTAAELSLNTTMAALDNSPSATDTDADGLSNDDEITLGTDPLSIDSDNDGLTDREEVAIYQSDPLVVDTDGDGLSDLNEVILYNSDPTLVDTDGDGYSDAYEVNILQTDPALIDSDGDGISDQTEIEVTLTNPVLADTDGDGLYDNEEMTIYNTNPFIADTDGDGFSDGNEVNFYETSPLDDSELPEGETTTIAYSPAEDIVGTIAFEDSWPNKGDYDFNDAVFNYNVEETKTNGLIKSIALKFHPVARGAVFNNSLRLQLDTPVSNIEQASIKVGGQTHEVTPVADGNRSMFVVIESIDAALPAPEGFRMANTEPDSPKVEGLLHLLTVVFKTPVPAEVLGSAPYNSYLARKLDNGEVLEIHFPGSRPTTEASKRQFGRVHDNSNKKNDRYFQSTENLPWAMIIPYEWSQPKEQVDLTNAYPDILEWANSNGKKGKAWYKSKRRGKFTYDEVTDID